MYGPGDQDIIVKLTTLSGDPNIFISLNSNLKFPTKEKSDIISTNTQTSDEIVIEADDLPLECRNVDFYQVFCTIHIGVFSNEYFDASSF